MRVEPRRADDPFSAASMLDERDDDEDKDDSDGPDAPYTPPKEGDDDDAAGRIRR